MSSKNMAGSPIVRSTSFSFNLSCSKLEVLSPVKKAEVEDKPQQLQQQHLQQQQQQLQQQSSQQGYEVQTLRNDLREKSARLEAAMAEKNQLARKLKALEQRDGTDHNKKVPITTSR